jgi:protein-L-isoaspartate(D-aspartate) O-methyltransferase
VTAPGSGREGSAARARHDMVDGLAASGAVRDPAVLGALRQVPREMFVPRFWSAPPGVRPGNLADVREWRVTDDRDDALRLVYDGTRALPIRRDPRAGGPIIGPRVTSTISAPNVVGMMLELLDIMPGMSILEIGAGSGYNAALLAELAGPAGSVTSVDIDDGLVAETSARMTAAGYAGVQLLAADGYFGVPQRAPFDRIVATVGCVDVSPAWLDQLSPGGFCLLPLQHGGWHPLITVRSLAGEVTGVVVGGTGFVPIQGRQAGHSPWARTGVLAADPDVEWAPLPEELASELRPEPAAEDPDGPRTWDLAYLLALEDSRAAYLLSLADEESSTAVSASKGRIGWAGPGGPALRDRLLEIASHWMVLGRPAMRDYRSHFRPLAAEGPAPEPVADSLYWTIRRLDFAQIVRLSDAGDSSAGGTPGPNVPGATLSSPGTE